jgi:hypothetical protein
MKDCDDGACWADFGRREGNTGPSRIRAKFDGYRLQLRIEDGNVALKTRKGLDWTAKFGAIAQAAA